MADIKGSSVQENITRLEYARTTVQQFVDGGGDPSSSAGIALSFEFLHAFDAVAQDSGYKILKSLDEKTNSNSVEPEFDPLSKKVEDILKIFTFDKKRDLEKYCRELIIDSSAFARFIMACEAGIGPFRHQIHYQDHMPESLHLTEADHAALSSNGIGSLQPGAQKAVNKIAQMFRDRRYLVGHIFFTPDLKEWHFFQFDQRDLEDQDNHWKEGAHIHFLNWLWPNFDSQILWSSFTAGRAKMDSSLHVRYLDAARTQNGSGKVF